MLGEALLFFGQPLRAPVDLRLITHAMHAGQLRLAQDHEVVGQTKEVRLHGFGLGGTRPGFGLTQLVLEFVKGLLPAPAGAALWAKAPPFGYLAPLGSRLRK